MRSKYFGEIETMEELKAEYRKMCFKLHPDKGGNEEDFKEMKNEYDEMVKILAAREKDSAKAEQTAELFKNIIDIIVNLDIDITIHGSWIWVECTKEQTEVHKILSSLKFFFNGKRKVWQWHNPEEGKARYSNKTESEIAATYGTIKVKGDKENNRDKKDSKNGSKKGSKKGLPKGKK